MTFNKEIILELLFLKPGLDLIKSKAKKWFKTILIIEKTILCEWFQSSVLVYIFVFLPVFTNHDLSKFHGTITCRLEFCLFVDPCKDAQNKSRP